MRQQGRNAMKHKDRHILSTTSPKIEQHEHKSAIHNHLGAAVQPHGLSLSIYCIYSIIKSPQ